MLNVLSVFNIEHKNTQIQQHLNTKYYILEPKKNKKKKENHYKKQKKTCTKMRTDSFFSTRMSDTA